MELDVELLASERVHVVVPGRSAESDNHCSVDVTWNQTALNLHTMYYELSAKFGKHL